MTDYSCPKCHEKMIITNEEKFGAEKLILKTTLECSNKEVCGLYKAVLFDDILTKETR